MQKNFLLRHHNCWYAAVIKDLAYRRPGMAWYHYDIQFRQMRQTINYRWDRMHRELWLSCAMGPMFNKQRFSFRDSFRDSQHSTGHIFSQNKEFPFNRSSCWSYNRTGHCIRPGCRFYHTCNRCKGPHPLFSCTNTAKQTSHISPKC